MQTWLSDHVSQLENQLTVLRSVRVLSLFLSGARFSRGRRDQGVGSWLHTSLSFNKGQLQCCYGGRTRIKGPLPPPGPDHRLPGTWRHGKVPTWVLASLLRVLGKTPPRTDTLMSSAIIPQLSPSLTNYPLLIIAFNTTIGPSSIETYRNNHTMSTKRQCQAVA